MNQSPSLTSSINTYNPQSFSSENLNSANGNIQNNSLNSSINTQSSSGGISISSSSIYSGTLENPPKSNHKINLTPIIFIVIVIVLAVGLFYKFYKDSKKSFK